MFSGIVEESAQVVSFEEKQGLGLLCVQSALDHSRTKIGDSIAIEGCCLTVVKIENKSGFYRLAFELAAETLRKTTLGSLNSNDTVNLERSMILGERIHGHLVFGHVDTVIRLKDRRPDGACERLEWELSSDYRKFVAPKGSVSIAGVSLTVGEKLESGFSVYIIPHTSEVTTLGRKEIGDRANFEVDMLARYVNERAIT